MFWVKKVECNKKILDILDINYKPMLQVYFQI